MNNETKDLFFLLLFVSIGIAFMTIFCFSIKDSEEPVKEVEVQHVPMIHSNSNGTMDMYLFPVID